jgi:hypothetical protein
VVVNPQATSIIAIPAALLAVNGLLAAAPLTRKRLHVRRVEQLSKVVNAAGSDCPKALRVKLIQEIYWITAYSTIRATARERLVLLAGWGGSILVYIVTIAFGAALEWYRSHSWFLYNAPTIGSAVILAVYVFPAAVVLDSLDARRRLYATFGGRSDLPRLRGPGLRRPSPTNSVVKGWVKEVLGDPEPDPRAVRTRDVTVLRRVIAEWESERLTRWPFRLWRSP